jgi:class 3 adenylate cyclase/tetratricopeptide (TPR) repeat protein
VTCPNCGFENTAGAKFCNECGTALNAGCPSCGATNPPGAKFCSECGTTLAGAEPAAARAVAAPQPPAAVAERRHVTVLFADIVGFTPFAEARDAEEVRDTLSRYFELCAQVIGRYGGTVEKYIGDAVMAVWGAPVAHEDDAERAVRAALDLVESVTSLGPQAQARAGVLTGEAAVTVGATNQGMVAGDLVNTAARLQSVAAPGTVLVGEATMRASSQAVLYEEAGEQALKGKQAPVAAWRALRVVSEVGGRNRSDQLEAPFVGRADELRLLKDLFHATGREGKVRLVSVMGPAGIGKSRLAWEFLKYVDGLVETMYWHSGRSPAYGEGISFWALGEMVRGRCGLVETDDEETTRAKVVETVATWVSDETERAWITPALLALLGIEAEVASDQLFAAWRTFFERIAAHGTVTLVFEDMHFADSGLLDFIEHLLEWSRGSPIYVVTLARPELLERRPDWGAGKRSFTSIYLEPLTSEQMRELLGGLVPGLPEAAMEAIVDRADGMPLYAVETVRMLVADGRLVLRDGAYQPTGDLTSLAVPETLTALITSRLDALDPADRALLHDAAVLGQSFTSAALAAVSGMPEAELEQRTAALIRREMLTRAIDARSPERGQLAFMQALIREVAYNTLARRDRKTRHLAAARYFEQIGSDELAGALANHYLSAYVNAAEGPEADALAAQARLALRGAAERAAALGAHDQAVAFLERALEIVSDDAERAVFLERAGDSAKALARADAPDYYEKAADIYRSKGDRHAAARVIESKAVAILTERRNMTALELLERSWEEYRDLWPAPELIDLRGTLARAYNQTAQYERAIEIVEEVLEAAEHSGSVPAIMRGLITKGACLASVGRLRESVALLDAAERLARDQNLYEELAGALVVGAFVRSELDLGGAFARNQEGVELARRIGQRAPLLVHVNNLGYTGFLTGDWDAALQIMEAELSEDLPRTHRVWLGGNSLAIRASRGEDVDALLAEVRRLTAEGGEEELQTALLDAEGNYFLATGQLLEARRAWLRIGELDRGFATSAHYFAGRTDLWRGDRAALAESAAALDATGVRGPLADARAQTLAAGLAGLEGRTAEAVAGYRAAVRAWREMGVAFEEALTGVDMVTALGPDDSDPAIVSSTRQILERLGARPYLERLERALGREDRPAAAQVGAPVESGAASTAR